MNFYDDEKPVVLIGVDLMIRAEQRRERDRQRGAGWGCKQANGSLNYVDHISRDTVYCPQCTPLLGHPHRCFWISDPKKATARYFRVRMLPVEKLARRVYMRQLSDVMKFVKDHAEHSPYRKGTPLREYRKPWKRDTEIEHYTLDGIAYLNLIVLDRKPAPDEIQQVKDAARAAWGVTPQMCAPKPSRPNPYPRDDGKTIVLFQWVAVQQGAMVLA